MVSFFVLNPFGKMRTTLSNLNYLTNRTLLTFCADSSTRQDYEKTSPMQ